VKILDQQRPLTPSDYIRANFQPSDRIAVLVRNAKLGEIVQRISTVERIAGVAFQDWMRYKNEREGCDIYVGMNALRPGAFTRTKGDIVAIRHLYVDLDRHGSAALAAIERSTVVPTPSYVLSTSPDKYQVIWKVEDIALPEAEALLHAMARQFDGDRAATDSARVLRLPGFLNKKYEQDFLVGVRSQTNRVYNLQDFKLSTELGNSDYRHPRDLTRKSETSERHPVSQSERDWAWVKSSLSAGADPEHLIAELARRRAADKPNPEYYARLTVTKAMVNLGISSPSGNASPGDDEQRELLH
jgi:RepB DNA-primase from phage plasmid